MIYNHRVYSATSGGLKSEIRMPAGTVLSRVSGSGCHSLLLCSHGMFPVCASLPASPYKDPIILDERSHYLQLTESANTLLSNVVIFMCMLCAQSLQSFLTLCDPMDRSPPGSSVHGLLRARMLEWIALTSSVDLPNPGIEPTSLKSPLLAGSFFTTSATWEAHRLMD